MNRKTDMQGGTDWTSLPLVFDICQVLTDTALKIFMLQTNCGPHHPFRARQSHTDTCMPSFTAHINLPQTLRQYNILFRFVNVLDNLTSYAAQLNSPGFPIVVVHSKQGLSLHPSTQGTRKTIMICITKLPNSHSTPTLGKQCTLQESN